MSLLETVGKIALLFILAYAITWFFGLRGITSSIVYGVVVGIPVLAMPLISYFSSAPAPAPGLIGGRRR